jgi:hypothetical protein
LEDKKRYIKMSKEKTLRKMSEYAGTEITEGSLSIYSSNSRGYINFDTNKLTNKELKTLFKTVKALGLDIIPF